MNGVGETVGVEEEFHLVDPATGRFAAGATALLESSAELEAELHQSMIETATEVWSDLTGLRADVVGRRADLVRAAAELGLGVAASGTLPESGTWTRPVQPNDRFIWLAAEYRQLVKEHQLCAFQVHVGVPDRDLAVRVCRRIRPWLPVLLALSASSPMFRGVDTGYASYRSVALSRWPTVGPPPDVESAKEYDDAVSTLVNSGVITDVGMIYFDARPSARYPTVEIRIGDACPLVEDAMLLAALGRALVLTAAGADGAGEPLPSCPEPLSRAATWRAARSGLDGGLIHPVHNRAARPWTVVGALVEHVRPALEQTGDTDVVLDSLLRLRSRGTAAHRQRRMLEQGAGPVDIVRRVVADTAAA